MTYRSNPKIKRQNIAINVEIAARKRERRVLAESRTRRADGLKGERPLEAVAPAVTVKD